MKKQVVYSLVGGLSAASSDATSAILSGDARKVRACVLAGVDPNERLAFGKTLSHVAALYAPDAEVLRVLAELGADFSLRDDEGRLPLHAAAGREDASFAAALLNGADVSTPDFRSNTPLHGASARCAELLIEAGAELSARGEYGETPLHRAVSFGSAETVGILTEAGADVKAVDNYGETPLHRAFLAENEGEEKIEIILTKDPDTSMRGYKDNALVHYAAWSGRGARYLADADWNEKLNEDTPLAMLAQSGASDEKKFDFLSFVLPLGAVFGELSEERGKEAFRLLASFLENGAGTAEPHARAEAEKCERYGDPRDDLFRRYVVRKTL